MKFFNLLNDLLDRIPQVLIVAAALVLLTVVGMVDYITGEEIGISIFYAMPVMLMAWCFGKAGAVITSFLSAAIWYIADNAAGHVYSHAAIPVWNAAVRLGFFLIVGLFVSILKDVLGHEKDLARTDSLTGITNTRSFYELAEGELERARRYGRPLSIVYMDLDNFKEVNDVYGHGAGDELLCHVAKTIKDNIRSSDIIARLGGDEFTLLLPETTDGDASLVTEKLRSLVMEGMPDYRFPVTLSIGAITYLALPATVEDMIREVDGLMYSVKNTTKNAIKHVIIKDEEDRWRMLQDRPGKDNDGEEG